MFISRRAGLLAAVFSAGLAFGSPVAAESLADAIALAYQTNPTLQAQRATLRALDESTVQARSGWRPSLSASASGQYTETRTPQQDRKRTRLNSSHVLTSQAVFRLHQKISPSLR